MSVTQTTLSESQTQKIDQISEKTEQILELIKSQISRDAMIKDLKNQITGLEKIVSELQKPKKPSKPGKSGVQLETSEGTSILIAKEFFYKIVFYCSLERSFRCAAGQSKSCN